MPPTPQEYQFIDERFDQLIGLSKDAVERALKYLFLANAGGAAATLSFLGAVPAMRLQWAPKVALTFFVLGLILVGVHAAIWVHYSESLYRNFRGDVTEFYDNRLAFNEVAAADFTRSQNTKWLYIVGYVAFACFIAGAATGLLGSSFSERGRYSMPDQYGDVTKQLEKMGLAKQWHVVEPVPGDLRNGIWIQNKEEGLDARFALSPAESDDLGDEEKQRRIRDAIANANKR